MPNPSIPDEPRDVIREDERLAAPDEEFDDPDDDAEDEDGDILDGVMEIDGDEEEDAGDEDEDEDAFDDEVSAREPRHEPTAEVGSEGGSPGNAVRRERVVGGLGHGSEATQTWKGGCDTTDATVDAEGNPVKRAP